MLRLQGTICVSKNWIVWAFYSSNIRKISENETTDKSKC